MPSLYDGFLVIISISYLFWGNILLSYFTLIELNISELDEPRSYLWLSFDWYLSFFGLLIPFLSHSGYRNMCFLLMISHMTVSRPNLEDASQSHINTVVALVSCGAWKCVVIVMIKKEITFFHLVTTFTTLRSKEKMFFLLVTTFTTPWSRQKNSIFHLVTTFTTP